MLEKGENARFEGDYDFFLFLFKTISQDGQEITDGDLERTVS